MPPVWYTATGRVCTAIAAGLALPSRAGAAEADLAAVCMAAYGDDDEHPNKSAAARLHCL